MPEKQQPEISEVEMFISFYAENHKKGVLKEIFKDTNDRKAYIITRQVSFQIDMLSYKIEKDNFCIYLEKEASFSFTSADPFIILYGNNCEFGVAKSINAYTKLDEGRYLYIFKIYGLEQSK